MSRNGSGTYSLPAGNPVVTGTTISSTWANTTLTDIASALTGSLAADGQTTATGNLNMGTNKITNTADPTNFQDVATKYYTDTAITTEIAATVTPAFVSDKVNTATGYFQVAKGTTLQRPSVPLEGIIRYNTDIDIYEGYINGDWIKFQTFSQGVYTANYLVVAGGAGGSTTGTGGGGGGGVVASSTTLTPGVSYTFVIGAGGSSSGTAGSNSVFTGVLTALGGGAPGASGGSGGGGGGSGTSGQGFNGGANVPGAGGGGGGGTTNGADATGSSSGGSGTSNGGAGGTGLSSSITGSAITYAGGGGGGKNVFAGPGSAGANGAGGGSTVNRGGGGQGATVNPGPSSSEAGGSGIIILSVPTANYTGTVTGAPTVSTSGSNTVMQFTASGSYTA
jgi:hypothetical protein